MARRRKKESPWLILIYLGILILILITQINSDFLFSDFAIPIIIFAILAIFVLAFAIFIVARKRQQKLKALRLSNIDQMTGTEFELYLCYLFNSRGYKASHIGKTNDYGVDLILKKGGVKTAVQAKRYKKPVGRRAISDAVGALKMYKCDQALIATNNYFTRQAKNLAFSNQVQLVDRDTLAQWIFEAQKN